MNKVIMMMRRYHSLLKIHCIFHRKSLLVSITNISKGKRGKDFITFFIIDIKLRFVYIAL